MITDGGILEIKGKDDHIFACGDVEFDAEILVECLHVAQHRNCIITHLAFGASAFDDEGNLKFNLHGDIRPPSAPVLGLIGYLHLNGHLISVVTDKVLPPEDQFVDWFYRAYLDVDREHVYT